jgi:riboflavin biosynthesis pyrimidine reductase
MAPDLDVEAACKTVRRLASELYGAAIGPAPGVVHVCSSVRASDGRLHVIKIGDAAPKSERDFFVLNFWRAHCDALLTTARIVRSEPRLSHALQGPHAAELEIYRRHALHKPNPPDCAIMTRNAGLPREHPIWHDPNRRLVLTAPDQVSATAAALGERAEVFGVEQLDARSAVAFLARRGARVILIEAGPSTANALYDAPACVDALLLSRCEASVANEAIGGALPEDAQLFAGLECVAEAQHEEASGSWRFQRWQRVSVSS